MRFVKRICSEFKHVKNSLKRKWLRRSRNKAFGYAPARKKLSFKAVPVLAVAIVLALAAVGGTIAYLTSRTDNVVNTFTVAKIPTDIPEEFNENYKTSAKVQNLGNVDAYIRVAVIANELRKTEEDEEAKIVGPADVSDMLGGDNWLLGDDGYYYYKQRVAPEGYTDDLIKDDIDLTDIQVTIASQAIQADGKDENGKFAVEAAWSNDKTVITVNADGTLSIAAATV